MAPQSAYKWCFETTTAVEGHAHAIIRTVFGLRTEFQLMEILETASYGKVLVLDGRIQSSVADDFIYHETLVHPAMIQHERPETALVIGGGEGATLREVLRYGSIRRVVMIDIDQAVIEACKVHLPEMHRGSFADERAELRFEDARAYLEATRERFDVAFIDLTEPMEEGPARFLFTREFYRLVSDRLTDRGLMAMQAGMTRVGELRFYAAMVKTLADSGLVSYEPYSGVRLSEHGRLLAAHVLRRHRLIELFLVKVMGMDWSEVHSEAELLEHAVSDRLIARMDEMLGHPSVDPHGDPIPDVHGSVEEVVLPTLLDCEVNLSLKVSRVGDQSRDFLQLVERRGLKPGSRLRVEGRDEAADAVELRLERGETLMLGFRAASKIYVEPLNAPPSEPARGARSASRARRAG